MSQKAKIIWGKDEVRLSPFCLEGLKLFWCLKDLKEIKGKVLEIGCGGGAMTKAIKFYRPDLKLIGCDIDQKAINWARKDAQGVEFRVGDAYRLPFADQDFSAVLTFDFLEHLEEPEKVITEAKRVLKNGGLFHNFVPLEGQLGTLYWFLNLFGWRGKLLTDHRQKFKFNDIRRLMEAKGFAIKRVHFGYHWSFQLVDTSHYLCWQRLKRRPVGESKLRWLKKFFAPLFNFESLLLAKIPGGGVSLGAIKNEKFI